MNTYYFCVRVVVAVDVLGFVIVLFQSAVFKHVIFCVCVVVAIRSICFGGCSRLRYRVVSEWCSQIHIRYRVVSEWCFQIHISLQWFGGGAVVHNRKTLYMAPEFIPGLSSVNYSSKITVVKPR